MSQHPIGGKAKRLAPPDYVSDNVRCEESEIEHLLNAAFRDAGFV